MGSLSCIYTFLPFSLHHIVPKLSLNTLELQHKTSETKMEQTSIMIKPDGVQRGLVGEIISRFEEKGFSLKGELCFGLKLISVDRPFAEKHYADLSAKAFFSGLVDYIISGPVVAMIWEGENVVLTGRKIIGATNPSEYAPGTIERNFIHGSDSVESARKEIALCSPDGSVNWDCGLRHLTSE